MTFQCDQCNKTFKSGKSLKYHIDHNVCINKNFICLGCNKCYKLKSSLKKHFKQKHPDKFDEIDWKKYHSFERKNTQKSGETTQNIGKMAQENCMCMFCKKDFSSPYNLKRHIATSCDVMKEEWFDEDESKNNDGIGGINSTNGTNNTNNTNNTLINNGNIINNNINIFNINNFGKEGGLPEEDMLEAIKDPDAIPLKYIELKHIKDKMNRNIYLESKQSNNIMVYKNNIWSERICEDICHLLKNESIDDIYEYIRNNNSISNEDAINDRLDVIEKDHEVLGDIKYFLYDNKSILSSSFNNIGKNLIIP
jgi:hypothetical protein